MYIDATRGKMINAISTLFYLVLQRSHLNLCPGITLHFICNSSVHFQNQTHKSII